MTYSPSAYAQRYDGRYWIFLNTPSGAVVRLISAYNTVAGAEQAIEQFGFRKVLPPTPAKPTITLHRGNTAPR